MSVPNPPEPFRTRGAAVDPDKRTVKRRKAVRVVMHTEDHILLFHDTDPGLPGSHWWSTPGGGIDGDETECQAVVREVKEETGIDIAPAEVEGPIATRVVHHGYSDQITIQDEVFFRLRRPQQDTISTAGHTESEQQTLVGHRWWPITELTRTTEPIWPINVVSMMSLPNTGTVTDLGTVEESTVPVGKERGVFTQ